MRRPPGSELKHDKFVLHSKGYRSIYHTWRLAPQPSTCSLPRNHPFLYTAVMPRTLSPAMQAFKSLAPDFEVLHSAIEPPREVRLARGFPPGTAPETMEAFRRAKGIERPYLHQALALEAIGLEQDVVISTGTASGKSLVYLVPTFDRAVNGKGGTTLAVFPLKALQQDQLTEAAQIAEHFKPGLRIRVFSGDTNAAERGRIVSNPPDLLLVNPDILHHTLLRDQKRYGELLGSIRMVAIDEIHAYRGIFGSHVAGVIRRLRLAVRKHAGCEPQFVCCSATMAQPQRHAQSLTGRAAFAVVDESKNSAPRPERQVCVVLPRKDIPFEEASAALTLHLLAHQMNVINFYIDRQGVERVAAYCRDLNGKDPRTSKGEIEIVHAYRGGHLPSERRKTERLLKDRKLRAVIATNALELGIDIGQLDACVLTGFPLSKMAYLQRIGRSGRRGGEALVLVLPAINRSPDDYYAKNPKRFFARPIEEVHILPEHGSIVDIQLAAGIKEGSIRTAKDAAYWGSIGKLLHRKPEKLRQNPHDAQIRGLRWSFQIHCTDTLDAIGEIEPRSVFRDCHVNAVYVHRGNRYRIKALDLKLKKVRAEPLVDKVQTRPTVTTSIQNLDAEGSHAALGKLNICRGRIRVTQETVQYEERSLVTNEPIGRYPVPQPRSRSFLARSLWITPGDAEISAGMLTCIERAALRALPMALDIEAGEFAEMAGMTYARHPETGTPTAFLFENVEEPALLIDRILPGLERLLAIALGLLQACTCRKGCPQCQALNLSTTDLEGDRSGAIAVLKHLAKKK